jgi:sarcosine oxidase subunit beta
MFAPMTGLLLSEIIMNETPSIDMDELSINRFKDKDEFHVEKSVV